MKKILLVIIPLAATLIVYLATTDRSIKQTAVIESEGEKKEPVKMEVNKENSTAPSQNRTQTNAGNPQTNLPKFRKISIGSNRVYFLTTSDFDIMQNPHDYQLGELIEEGTIYDEAIAIALKFKESINNGEFPDEIFEKSVSFFMRNKLNVESIGKIDSLRLGWPSYKSGNQLNLPVKFSKGKSSAAGEIIFELVNEKWKILDISVQFSELKESGKHSNFDDLVFPD